jgi:DNA-directed RNA polymerase specialized sigma subunit
MKKYYALSADQEDLISIGTIGLIKGISTFKPEKGARLATYAARCIENPILTSRTLTVTMVTLRLKNVMYGVFWIKFPRICISFAVHRILM